jgi:hypothetical protein
LFLAALAVLICRRLWYNIEWRVVAMFQH